MSQHPIGIFDSGYGGLTVLREIVKTLPDHDFLYLGDNARTPYGTRSYETIYAYTLQAVKYLFDQGCELVILACNTASAKALRTIQQRDLPQIAPHKRVLGVIRPTAEVIASYTHTGHIGVLGTTGTVKSESYLIEIKKQAPTLNVHQQACPMWVPLIENGEQDHNGADYFVKKYLDELFSQSQDIDTLLLACTHYPLMLKKMREYLPETVTILNQGDIVAPSLADYLQRHPEIAEKCSQNGKLRFVTTDSPENFDRQAATFFGQSIKSNFVDI
ncbi:glutamate racemase [Marinoscillum furvescens]|uniref:Glutamate racemase n=1 Tax=Marinoscillum furvescens DSM 4134 TaxID=1122208 RepID=A0A3D9KWN7_MARFU|nr:glutamate racemase [Marinoscillum furvescens]RED92661.1 glutamate racemase [Marinoscillum furvescens DSM 4134]